MKKLFFISVVIMATLSFASSAYEQPQGIEVSGKASVEVVPDQFLLSFSIVTRGISASKTKAMVDHKTTLVINVAKRMGIKNESIQSARMNLRPIYQKSSLDYSNVEVKQNLPTNKEGRVHLAKNISKSDELQPYIFEVSRQITINLSEISNYDRLLDQIVKIGVTNISSLTMSVSKADIYYQKALAQAITVAKEKALKISAQAGVELGKLIYLKEISYNAPTRMTMSFNSESATMHKSQTGTKQITAEVIATFALHP